MEQHQLDTSSTSSATNKPPASPGTIKLSPEELFALSSGAAAAAVPPGAYAGFFSMPPGSAPAGSSPWAPLPFIPHVAGGRSSAPEAPMGVPGFMHLPPHQHAAPWPPLGAAPAAAAAADNQAFEQGLRSLLSMGATSHQQPSRVSMPPKPYEPFLNSHQMVHIVPQGPLPRAAPPQHHLHAPPSSQYPSESPPYYHPPSHHQQQLQQQQQQQQQYMYSMWQLQQQQQQQQQPRYAYPTSTTHAYGTPLATSANPHSHAPALTQAQPTVQPLSHESSLVVGGDAPLLPRTEHAGHARPPAPSDAEPQQSDTLPSSERPADDGSGGSVEPPLPPPASATSDDTTEASSVVCRGPPASDVSGSRESELAQRLIESLPRPNDATYHSISLGAYSLIRSIQPPRFDYQQREELLARLQHYMEEGFPRTRERARAHLSPSPHMGAHTRRYVTRLYTKVALVRIVSKRLLSQGWRH